MEYPVFRNFKPEYSEILAACLTKKEFGEGKYVFHEGQTADFFYLVEKGHISLEIHGHGNPHCLLTLGPGDVLGWSWMFEPYHWSFDAHVLEHASLLAFNAATIRKKCEENPGFGYDLLKRFAGVMASRLEATRLQLLDFYDNPGR